MARRRQCGWSALVVALELGVLGHDCSGFFWAQHRYRRIWAFLGTGDLEKVLSLCFGFCLSFVNFALGDILLLWSASKKETV